MDYSLSFDALPWQEPMPGVREKRWTRGGRVLRLVEFSTEMEPHWCVKGHIGHVVDGVLELQFGSQVVTVKTGDALFIPHGPEHAHRAIAKTPTVTALFVEEAPQG